MRKARILMMSAALVMLTCCELSHTEYEMENSLMPSISARAVMPTTFDWENADWMPTPPMQSKIPAPWVGQGSIASTYGTDVANDRKASEGWILLYNTFDENATAPLTNPYFILYNKYNGLMRIFFYLTTEFVAPSSYMQDALSIISTHQTSLLSFMGESILNLADPRQYYGQIQPVPIDGSAPLATNRWYMLQYELAYDPNLSKIPYNEIQLNWSANYCNIQEINLQGEVKGTINGTLGYKSNKALNSSISTDATGNYTAGIIAGIGSTFFERNLLNPSTGENKTGLPNNIFKSIYNELVETCSSSNTQDGIPKKIMGILSSLFKGEGSKLPPINLVLDAQIKLKGNIAEKGSLPSTPVSHWVPGTDIPSTAIGYIPLYNKPLGVVNISTPDYTVEGIYVNDFMYPLYYRVEEYRFTTPKGEDCIKINPEIQKIADVELVNSDLIVISNNSNRSISRKKTNKAEQKRLRLTGRCMSTQTC